MTRHANYNEALALLYQNLLDGAAPLRHEVQQRIFRYATRTKDADLAAGLARRPDTLDEIDRALASWAVAKVQSAWFARPGRDLAEVAVRLESEKRVTVLEVAAAIEGLDDVIYDALADKDALRIAIRLLANSTAPTSARTRAAATAGRAYHEMSYERARMVTESLRDADPACVTAFVTTQRELGRLVQFLASQHEVSTAAADHVYKLCQQRLVTVRKLERQWRAEQQSNQRSWWRAPYITVLHEVAEAVDIISKRTSRGSAGEQKLLLALDSMRTWFSSNDRRDKDAISELDVALLALGSSPERTSNRVAEAAAAGSVKAIAQLVEQWSAGDETLDSMTAMALLRNEHIDVDTVFLVVEAMSWRSHDRQRLLHSTDYRVDVLGAVLFSLFNFTDDEIEQYAGPYDPSDVWEAAVLASVRQVRYGSNGLLSSRHARGSIVPKLPLSVLQHAGTPEWLTVAFGDYLADHLTSDAAWDGFEILAKTHLGTVEQIVRAAIATTRRG